MAEVVEEVALSLGEIRHVLRAILRVLDAQE